jgi:O-antigen/teichoic acid export membrane protein
MKNWLVRIDASSLTRKIALVAGSVASAQVIQVMFTPVLTRIYRPEDLGLLGIYLSVLSIVMLVASLSYEQAIPLPSDDGQAAGLVVLAFTILCLVTALSALPVFVFSDWVIRLFRLQDLEAYLWILPIAIFIWGLYRILNTWAIRKEAYSAIARTNIVQSLIKAVFQSGLGIVISGPLGLILGNEIGQAGGFGPLIRLAYSERRLVGSVRLQDIRQLLVRYKKFPLITSWSMLLNNLSQQLPIILLALLYSSQIVGFFSLSDRIIRSLVRTLGMAVAQVYVGAGSKLLRDDPLALRVLFDNLSKRLLLVGLGPCVFLMIFSPDLFAWIFGPEWRQAGIYTQTLSPMLLGQFIIYPLSQSTVLMEKQSLQFLADLLRTSMIVFVFMLSQAMDWQVLPTLKLYSLASLTIYIVYYFIYRWVIWSRSNEWNNANQYPGE